MKYDNKNSLDEIKAKIIKEVESISDDELEHYIKTISFLKREQHQDCALTRLRSDPPE